MAHPFIEVSGVLNSCDTEEINSFFISSLLTIFSLNRLIVEASSDISSPLESSALIE